MISLSNPERMCIVCRNMKPKSELTRIVKNKDGQLFVDKLGKAMGRGAYVCKSAECSQKLLSVRALARAFHCEISAEITENIMKELI